MLRIQEINPSYDKKRRIKIEKMKSKTERNKTERNKSFIVLFNALLHAMSLHR